MFCAGFHDINSCRLDAGMTEQVRQFRDIFFEVVKCPRKQEIENILKTAGFILFFLKKLPSPLPQFRILREDEAIKMSNSLKTAGHLYKKQLEN